MTDRIKIKRTKSIKGKQEDTGDMYSSIYTQESTNDSINAMNNYKDANDGVNFMRLASNITPLTKDACDIRTNAYKKIMWDSDIDYESLYSQQGGNPKILRSELMYQAYNAREGFDKIRYKLNSLSPKSDGTPDYKYGSEEEFYSKYPEIKKVNNILSNIGKPMSFREGDTPGFRRYDFIEDESQTESTKVEYRIPYKRKGILGDWSVADGNENEVNRFRNNLQRHGINENTLKEQGCEIKIDDNGDYVIIAPRALPNNNFLRLTASLYDGNLIRNIKFTATALNDDNKSLNNPILYTELQGKLNQLTSFIGDIEQDYHKYHGQLNKTSIIESEFDSPIIQQARIELATNGAKNFNAAITTMKNAIKEESIKKIDKLKHSSYIDGMQFKPDGSDDYDLIDKSTYDKLRKEFLLADPKYLDISIKGASTDSQLGYTLHVVKYKTSGKNNTGPKEVDSEVSFFVPEKSNDVSYMYENPSSYAERTIKIMGYPNQSKVMLDGTIFSRIQDPTSGESYIMATDTDGNKTMYDEQSFESEIKANVLGMHLPEQFGKLVTTNGSYNESTVRQILQQYINNQILYNFYPQLNQLFVQDNYIAKTGENSFFNVRNKATNERITWNDFLQYNYNESEVDNLVLEAQYVKNRAYEMIEDLLSQTKTNK